MCKEKKCLRCEIGVEREFDEIGVERIRPKIGVKREFDEIGVEGK
jgi:hypothetical protein